MRNRAALAMLLASASAVAAEPVKLVGKALEDAVSGAVVEIDTPLGTKVPLHYYPDGRVTGKAGDVAFYLGTPEDEGRWWIASSYKLCHKWQHWFDREDMCLVIKRDGTTIHWRDSDGDTGTATLVENPDGAPTVVAAAAPQPEASEKRVAALAPLLTADVTGSLPAKTSPPAVAAEPETPAAPPVTAAAAPVPAETTPPPSAPKDAKPAVAPAPKTPAASAKGPKAKPRESKTAAAPEKAKAKQAAAPAPIERTFRVTMVSAGDVLWIRQGPSQDQAAVGSIPHQGQGVLITGMCQGEWCPVKYGRYAGWANHWYLEPETRDAARVVR